MPFLQSHTKGGFALNGRTQLRPEWTEGMDSFALNGRRQLRPEWTEGMDRRNGRRQLRPEWTEGMDRRNGQLQMDRRNGQAGLISLSRKVLKQSYKE